MSRRTISFRLNGEACEWEVADNALLLNELREHEALTGSKYGCGIGECGACTVLVDGKAVVSCLVLAQSVNGLDVLTIEGLAPADRLDPLQESFLDCAALQCGFCTPGMIMTARALLNENAEPTESDVRDFLRGNLCRCTGYASIVRAVLAASEAGRRRVMAHSGEAPVLQRLPIRS